MGLRILYDNTTYTRIGMACLYCSSADWAFGPVFYDGDQAQGYRTGQERARTFLRWLSGYTPPTADLNGLGQILGWKHDPRELSDGGLAHAFVVWLAQEAQQYAREEAETRA